MFELDYKTKYISVLLEFDYDSKNQKSKFTPSIIRETFLGICPPKHPNGRGSPNFPKVIKMRCGYTREIIFPLYFSLIKKPVKANIPGRKPYTIRNSAVGTAIFYEYLGLLEDYEKCCKEIKGLIEEKRALGKPKHFAPIKSIKIIVGYDLEDVTKK